ncbi:MAG: hypothetical protein CMP61_10595 [Flavobacteriales bacterium]|nr:hypothetical protein [Flavobacteriales bacterium]|tara:strand:- start:3653 stop:4057 length:405 start_codon:yes stop_codon:yes gene_type:complete
MSAWGISNFENDTALDWVAYLIEEKQGINFKKFINTFVSEFTPDETSLIECSKFLTVAETVAGLAGNPADDFPEELSDWVETKYIKIEQVTLDKAIEGVKLVMVDSEAKEMYLDSGYFKSWEKAQKDLIKRLSE